MARQPRQKNNEYRRAWRAANLEKAREYGRKYRRNHKEQDKVYRLRKKYRLTPEGVEEMFKQQSGLCAACGKPLNPEKFDIDHCHRSDKVRGLVHNSCNLALGAVHDDVEVLLSLVEYIRKHGVKIDGE